jgi:hypothetical protein
MVMPDAIDALLALGDAARPAHADRVQRRGVLGVGGRYSRGRGRAFPTAAISYRVDEKRQGIVDSWPAAVDDWRRAPIGGSAALRFPTRVQRLPGADDSGAVSKGRV